MAEGKKGFILYADIIHTVKKLPIEKRGELFTVILEYVNDENPEVKDILIDLVFEPIKRQLKRDLHKYEIRAERSRENGKLGGRPKNLVKPKKPTRLKNNLTKPRKPDTVNVNDIVIVTVNDKEREISILRAFKENVINEAKNLNIEENTYIEFLEYWTEKDFETQLYQWQTKENFGIKSRLKNWKRLSENGKENWKEELDKFEL